VPLLGSSAILGAAATGQLQALIDKLVSPAISKIMDWAEGMGPVSPSTGREMITGVTRLATFTVSGLAAMTLAGEALSPLKHIGLGHISAVLYDLINYKTLTAAFMGVLAFVYIRTPLTYYYNKIARPNIPDERTLQGILGDYEITPDEYVQWMQFHGYTDEWSRKMIDQAYRPLTPYMLRSLAEAGLLPEDVLDRELHHAGYREEVIPIIKQMMDNLASGALVAVSASTAMTRFQEGFDDEAALRHNLRTLGVADKMLDRYVFASNLKYLYDYQSDLKAYYIDAYHRRDIEEPELRSELTLAGLSTDRLDLVVNAQKIKRLAIPKVVETAEDRIPLDTIRDKRAKNLITREEEISELVAIGKKLSVAIVMADNDDVKLAPSAKPLKVKVLKPYETRAGKIQVDTIRDLRVAVQMARGEEISRLLAMEMPIDIATAIADNDDTAIALKAVKVTAAAPALYETEAGKLETNNIRALRVDRQIDRATEISRLAALEMPDDICTAMADADDFKIAQRIEMEVKPVLAPYETEAGKVQVDTIRRLRRQGQTSADEELTALSSIQMPAGLAQAIVDNDALRIKASAAGGA
jgi:hypothetical protein